MMASTLRQEIAEYEYPACWINQPSEDYEDKEWKRANMVTKV